MLTRPSLGRWVTDARKWFKGPVINLSKEELAHVHLDKDEPPVQADDIEKWNHTATDDDLKSPDLDEKEDIATAQDAVRA